jgi:hypothetical protein
LKYFPVLCIVCFTWHNYGFFLQNFWWLFPWCMHYRSVANEHQQNALSHLISHYLWLICVCAPGWCSFWIGGRVSCLLSRPASYFSDIRDTIRGVLVW